MKALNQLKLAFNIKIMVLFLVTIFVGGCKTTSKEDTSIDPQNFKDVYILSNLIQSHFRKTNERAFTLEEMIQNDTLKRISNSFKEIELKYHGGYISILFRFSDFRNNAKIELTDKENSAIKTLRWREKRLKGLYNGEIQFNYGERFWGIRRITLNKQSSN